MCNSTICENTNQSLMREHPEADFLKTFLIKNFPHILSNHLNCVNRCNRIINFAATPHS